MSAAVSCTPGSPEQNLPQNGFICPVKIPNSSGLGEPSIVHDSQGRLFVTAPQAIGNVNPAGGSPLFTSANGGRTWGPMVHVSPGFPASGGDSAPLVVEPGGRIDMSYQGYNIYDLKTYAMSPAYTFFTSSADGGRTWSPPVQVGPSAGTMSAPSW